VISEAKFFGIVFQGNPAWQESARKKPASDWSAVAIALRANCAQQRGCNKIAPRKTTGARNVTGKSAFSNGTIELSQSIHDMRFSVRLKCNRMHVVVKWIFGVVPTRSGTTEKTKARRSRAFDEYLFLSVHFASLAIACVRRDTFRLALFL